MTLSDRESSGAASSSPDVGKNGLDEVLKGRGVHLEDENRICWNEDARSHPRNWGIGTKIYTTVLVSWLELFVTAISSSGVSDDGYLVLLYLTSSRPQLPRLLVWKMVRAARWHTSRLSQCK